MENATAITGHDMQTKIRPENRRKKHRHASLCACYTRNAGMPRDVSVSRLVREPRETFKNAPTHTYYKNGHGILREVDLPNNSDKTY